MITLLTILMLNWPIDKVYHFGAGFAISWTIGKATKPSIGLYSGNIAGIAKETRDYYSYGKFDNKDLLATSSGSFLPFIVWLVPKPFQVKR